MKANPANARFWLWHKRGWVKLTLRPGQAIRFADRGRTDEGWFRGEDGYEHVGDGVLSTSWSEESDCDGRLDRSAQHFCPLDLLRARDMHDVNPSFENVGIFAPEWANRDAWQRDYAAEAAGY